MSSRRNIIVESYARAFTCHICKKFMCPLYVNPINNKCYVVNHNATCSVRCAELYLLVPYLYDD